MTSRFMNDGLLPEEGRKEAFSRAYAHAVAARAGCLTAVYDQDRDGVDLRIQAGGEMRPAIELQLKATINLATTDDGYFRFRLKRRNYDLLRMETQTPRLLVVLDLPRDESRWMTITADELVLRRRAYWLNLRGMDETTNPTSVTVRIPEQNVFNHESLQALMVQSSEGSIR